MAVSRLTISQSAIQRSGRPRMAIYTESQTLVFTSRFAPREISYSGYEATYNEIARPDRKPILSRSGNSLRKISMSIFVGSTDPEESFDSELKTLEQMASSRIPIFVEMDPRTYGKWHITAMSYTSVERRNDTDEITRANVEIELTEITTNTDITINQVTRGRPKNFTPTNRTSMFKIAKQFYGTKNLQIVRAIAAVNGITNLRRVPPGKPIRLP